MEHISKHLIINQNSAPARQEWKPSRTGDEVRLDQALQQSKIKDAPVERIKQVLRLAMLKVGIRAANLPNDEEKAVLLSHAISEYGGHTPDEIGLAFDMAISGKLDVDVNCYENFSCAYFSSIMNAYRKWAVQAYKPEIQAPEQKIYNQGELDNIHRADVEAYYQRVRSGKPTANIPEYFRFILDKDGLIRRGETLEQFFYRKINKGAGYIYRKDPG